MPLLDRLRALLRTGWRLLRQVDLAVQVALLAAVVAVWGFAKLADEVAEGETRHFDEAVLLALRDPHDPADAIGPPAFEEAVRDITSLGGVAVLTLVVAIVVGYLVLVGKRHAVWLVLVASLGGALLSTVLKDVFGRPRPSVVPHLMYAGNASFPSGHSLLSAVIYLTLGSLLDRLVERPAVRLYVLSIAILLTGLVGCSRVYLGVHYPTDVLGGWAVGLAWAVACWLTARWLQGRGVVETPDR